MVDVETAIEAVFCQLGSTVTCFGETRTARSCERAGERTNVSILTGRMECCSAVVDASLLQCQGELTNGEFRALALIFDTSVDGILLQQT